MTAHRAQADGEGLWPLDTTQKPTVLVGPPEVSKDVILPKLYRRLGEYMLLNNGDPDLGGFVVFLRRKADTFTILSTGHTSTGLDLSSRSTTARSAGPTTSRTSSSTTDD